MAELTHSGQELKKTTLRNAERAWMKKLDSKCAAQDDGLATRLDEASCILDMTSKRTKELEAQLKH